MRGLKRINFIHWVTVYDHIEALVDIGNDEWLIMVDFTNKHIVLFNYTTSESETHAFRKPEAVHRTTLRIVNRKIAALRETYEQL